MKSLPTKMGKVEADPDADDPPGTPDPVLPSQDPIHICIYINIYIYTILYV